MKDLPRSESEASYIDIEKPFSLPSITFIMMVVAKAEGNSISSMSWQASVVSCRFFNEIFQIILNLLTDLQGCICNETEEQRWENNWLEIPENHGDWWGLEECSVSQCGVTSSEGLTMWEDLSLIIITDLLWSTLPSVFTLYFSNLSLLFCGILFFPPYNPWYYSR